MVYRHCLPGQRSCHARPKCQAVEPASAALQAAAWAARPRARSSSGAYGCRSRTSASTGQHAVPLHQCTKTVWMAGLEPAVSGFRRRRIARLSHIQITKKGQGSVDTWPASGSPKTGCHNRRGCTRSVQAGRPASSVSRLRLQSVIPTTVIFPSSVQRTIQFCPISFAAHVKTQDAARGSEKNKRTFRSHSPAAHESAQVVEVCLWFFCTSGGCHDTWPGVAALALGELRGTMCSAGHHRCSSNSGLWPVPATCLMQVATFSSCRLL